MLCKEMNDRGITTTRGGELSIATLSRALDSGFGAGLLVQSSRTTGRDDEFLPGSHQPVITPDEWTAYRDARASRKLVAPRRRTAGWFLAGLAICGRCGDRLIVTTRAEGKSQALCSGYHNGKGCDGVWIKRQTLEQRVAIWLGAHIEDLPERSEADAEAGSVVRDLEVALTEVSASLTRLATGFAEGILDADGYRGAQAGLLERRRVVENELRAARAEATRTAPLDRDVYSRLDLGDEPSAGEWNHLLGKALRRVEVHPDRLVLVPVVGEATEVARTR